MTSNGFVVQPAITIPANATSLTIGRDGTVSVTQPGSTNNVQIGQLQLATFMNPTGLESLGTNLYAQTDASGAPNTTVPGLNGSGVLQQNYVESSNVNVVQELVDMIQTQRAYEINSKAVQTSDQMLQRLTSSVADDGTGAAPTRRCFRCAAATGCALAPREPWCSCRPRPAPRCGRAAPNGSIFQSSYAGMPLFEDARPRNVGDILTIIVSENVNATKNSGANASRASSSTLAFDAVPRLFGGLFGTSQNANMSGANSLKASGGASAANTFNGTITVTVLEVLPNGNLLVSGEKQMEINGHRIHPLLRRGQSAHHHRRQRRALHPGGGCAHRVHRQGLYR